MTESVPRIVDMSEIGPHVIDAVWTDDYGREYHLVGRERLTAAEDEIARLTVDLAETERERQKAVEREAKTAEALTEARGRERDWRRVAEQHEEATRILGGGGSLPVLAQAAVDRAESLRAQLTEARHRLSDAVEYPGFPGRPGAWRAWRTTRRVAGPASTH